MRILGVFIISWHLADMFNYSMPEFTFNDYNEIKINISQLMQFIYNYNNKLACLLYAINFEIKCIF